MRMHNPRPSFFNPTDSIFTLIRKIKHQASGIAEEFQEQREKGAFSICTYTPAPLPIAHFTKGHIAANFSFLLTKKVPFLALILE